MVKISTLTLVAYRYHGKGNAQLKFESYTKCIIIHFKTNRCQRKSMQPSQIHSGHFVKDGGGGSVCVCVWGGGGGGANIPCMTACCMLTGMCIERDRSSFP